MQPVESLAGDWTIRPFAPGDAAELRRIAVETADAGRDGSAYVPDRRLLADLLTRYTTDVEPGSCWVAARDGRLGGYIAGSMDDRGLARRTMLGPGPRILLSALFRGVPFRPWSLRFLARNLPLWTGRRSAAPDLGTHPGHLHINLVPEARGAGVGVALMGRFLDAARSAGVTGVRANVREDNAAARRFFERQGFRAMARFVAFRAASADLPDWVTVIYGLRLLPPAAEEAA